VTSGAADFLHFRPFPHRSENRGGCRSRAFVGMLNARPADCSPGLWRSWNRIAPTSYRVPFCGLRTMSEKASKTSARILLVDDDAEIIESMRITLEAKGYQVLIARDGNQGLALAEKENPDLLILDMMMPKRSGFLVLEKIRRSRPVPLKIIMITANEGSRHKAYAEMLGVDDYLRKPFGMDRLLESVGKLLAE